MEIRDYLRAIRRLLWLPIAAPIVAALLTGFLLERQPSQYQASATVVVPAISARGLSSSAASQYVSTFKDVLVSQPVVSAVSQKTGVPTSDLVAGLSASTITTSSNVIHVTYTGPKDQNITEVAQEATIDAMNAIAQPQLIQAQQAVANAQTQLQDAESAITTWITSTGNVLPQQQFNNQQQELNQLLLQLQQARIANDTARIAALTSVIAQRQQQLASLATQVTEYQSLSDARQAALSARDHASQELTDAQSLVAADQNPNVVTVVDNGRVSKLADTLKFTGIAFAVALIMALGVILLLELMRSERRRKLAVVPGHEPAAASELGAVSGNGVAHEREAAVGEPVAAGGGMRAGLRRQPFGRS